MVMALPASAQEQENQRRDQDQPTNQARQGQEGQQNQQGQQTIRGTVAGVTSVGEAVIDPQTGTAVAVQVNYLTVLGSPGMGGQGRGAAGQPRGQGRPDQPGQGRQANRGRQNLYLIAITPQTTVRQGAQQAGQDQAAPQKEQAESAFEKLEIGDRVTVQFKTAERLHAKAQEGEQRVAGFRGDARNKHGRNRIFVGEASEINVMAAGAGGQRGPGAQRRQQRGAQDDNSN